MVSWSPRDKFGGCAAGGSDVYGRVSRAVGWIADVVGEHFTEGVACDGGASFLKARRMAAATTPSPETATVCND